MIFFFMQFIDRLKANRLYQFLLLWFLVGIVYLPSWKAGFVSDFLGMFGDIDRVSFADFINRSEATVKSFYQVTQLQMYVFIKVFGTHFIPWFLITTALHALNGVVVFTFFKRLFKDFQLRHSELIAFCGVLLFLLNPNITEVTVWKGGYHYLTGILIQFLILIWCQRYCLGGKKQLAVAAFVLFLLSLFTLEIFYVTPALTFMLILGYRWKNLIDKNAFQRALRYFFLPQVLLFICHLLLFRLLYGTWVAHYGTTTTFELNLHEILPRIGKYLAYIIIMAGHIPFKIRGGIYDFLAQMSVAWFLALLLPLVLIILLVRFKRLSSAAQLATFLLAAVIFCLILVIPIYFDDLFSLYNSRRCYQPGLFIYMLISLFIFSIFSNKKVAVSIFSAYLLLCLALTARMVLYWRTAAKVQYGILRTFNFQNADPVILLNVPTYYKDIRIMPVNADNEFNTQLKIFGYAPIKGQLYEASSYNMQHLWDGAHVTVLDSMTLKITLNQWGTWWIYNYVGAGDYETDLYKVKMTDPGHEYILTLKSRPENMAILFSQDIYWRKVDMNKRGEQW
jgi:hypothetical protein